MGRTASGEGVLIFIQEELGDARLRCNQLKNYVNEAVELIEKSDNREHFFEVAGHLLHGIPDTLLRMEKALGAAAMAVSKWDYEETKEDLQPEKAEQLEDALKDVRTRRVERRSSNQELSMKTDEAVQELNRIARSIETTGHVDDEAIRTLIAALEGNGQRVASSKRDVASALRGLAKTLEGKARPSRAVFATALRRVFAETMDVGSASPPTLPAPGFTPYNLADGFEFIRDAAVVAYRRGSSGQTRQAFDQLASVVSEIGLMFESIGSNDVPTMAIRLSKSIRTSKRLLTPDVAEAMTMQAAEKNASHLAVTQMLRSYNEGLKFGEFEVGDVSGAADRLEAAAMKAARLAFQYHLDTPPTNLFIEIASRVHDLAFYMGATAADPSAALEVGDHAMSDVVASDKTAASPSVAQMVTAFREGAEFGQFELRDVRGAAMRLSAAAKSAAKHALRKTSRGQAPVALFRELSDRVYDLAFYIGSASAALVKTARFEEGKPADPTEHMDESDAEKWKTEHDENKDNFKAASKNAGDEKLSRFEEGKPADPTENMSEQDAEEWKDEHDKNKDNFKAASNDSWKV